MSTAGNKGSSLSTPGTVRSTPSSEALDVVADLRYESLRYRSLPVSHKNGDTSAGEPVSYSKETNGNLFHDDGPITLPSLEFTPKQYQTPPVTLNGNANNATSAQNVEDLYAKVSLVIFKLVFLC